MSFLRGLVICLFMLAMINVSYAGTATCKYNFDNDEIGIGYGNLATTFNITKNSDGIKYTYFIKDVNNFNELNDYVTLENAKGHKITYALKCTTKNVVL